MKTIFTDRYKITCTNCGKEHSVLDSQSFCRSCGHGHPLQLNYLDFSPLPQLPFELDKIPSMVPTSLVLLNALSERYKANIYAKCEFELPTGSFKHRGSVAEVLFAKKKGFRSISCASTGNMGVSLASMCAREKMSLILFVPKNTPVAKLAAAQKFGATINFVDGTYSDCEREAAVYAHEQNVFLAGDYYLRVEGAKLVAAEMLEQLSFNVPDLVIVPGGVGTNATAVMKGFEELRTGGMIATMPVLSIVQSESCCPIIDSLEVGVKVPALSTNTLCSATAVADPYDFVKVQRYIKMTGGFGIKVSDKEALVCGKELAQTEGIDCELSGAMPVAALEKIQKAISGKTVVLVITGAGYKDMSIQQQALVEIQNIKK